MVKQERRHGCTDVVRARLLCTQDLRVFHTSIIDGPPMSSNLYCLQTKSSLDSLTNYYFYNYSLSTMSLNGNPFS